MRITNSIHLRNGTREELFPGFTDEFPYFASRAELNQFDGGCVQWHWHKEIELFYVESGEVEYFTPQGKTIFPKGSAGMVNSNVLHMTREHSKAERTVQLLHIFDPSLMDGGRPNGRIRQKYITPLLAAPQIEVLSVREDTDREHLKLLKLLQESFRLSEEDFGYELKLCAVLSEIWCGFLKTAMPLPKGTGHKSINETVKQMMLYIQEHYSEKIMVSEIAASVFISERECYRIFRESLHMTPVEYLTDYRIHMACHMLAEGRESVTCISNACGLGSSSHFGQVFHGHMGCTPLQYRRKWQDIDNQRQKRSISI